MSTSTEARDLACRCETERELTRFEQFEIVPRLGGGWSAWIEALARMIDRLAALPAHCVIVTQEPNQRYVQMMVGHGRAHIEVSSNHYLIGDFRLDTREEAALEALGFRPPDLDAGSARPRNWWRDDERADGETIAGRVVAVLTTVVGFDERAPVIVEVFGADHPCATCFWSSDA